MKERLGQNKLLSFFNKLIALETGIKPENAEWYQENLDIPSIKYARVDKPGRVIRSLKTGGFIYDFITIREYFSRIGVIELYKPNCSESLKSMQYRTINALGFIGYQIGEAILITLDYYKPMLKKSGAGIGRKYPRYYLPVDNSHWKGGLIEKELSLFNNELNIIVTDVNCWDGSFTGKNGILSLEDLMCPIKQEIVIRDIMKFNINYIKEKIESHQIKFDEIINKTWVADGKIKREKMHTALSHENEVIYCTVAGLAACAHLAGADAVIKLLLNDKLSEDEFDTSILSYMRYFSDSEIKADDFN